MKNRRRPLDSSAPTVLLITSLTLALLALLAISALATAPVPDPRHECLYAALSEAPELIPSLDPEEKIYGRVSACDGLSDKEKEDISSMFRRAMAAAVAR
jgi:hypothetical protein